MNQSRRRLQRPRRFGPRWLFIALAAAVALPAHATNRLQSVAATQTDAGGVNIRLQLAESAPAPSVFTVDDPARLSIDLADTQPGGAKRFQKIDVGPVASVATAASQGRTRVVVALKRMVEYKIHRRGDQIVVALAGGRGAQPRPTAAARTAAAAAAAPTGQTGAPTSARRASAGHPQSASPSVDSIDFRRGKNGAGRVIIGLAGDHRPVDVKKRGGKIVARLDSVRLPPRLRKRYDVRDFATPVATVDAMARGDATRIVITPRADHDYQRVAYQTGDRFIVELQPGSDNSKAPGRQKPRYTGKKISLSFQNIEVRAVLQIIADVADVNLVVSDSVSGNIALRLEDVPWDQALDIILKAKNLGMRRVNNVISVAPLAQIAAREQAQLAARNAQENLAPLTSEIIQINYARAGDIADILRNARKQQPDGGPASPNPGSAAGKNSLLSARGHVNVDARTNSLLLNETRSRIAAIRKVIDRLDVPVRQVQIQARLVVANRDFSRSLGIRQTGVDNANLNNQLDTGNSTNSNNGGNIGGNGPNISNNNNSNNTRASVRNNNFGADNGGFLVGLPAAGATSLLSASIITDTFSLNLELTAMETENRGEIISSPRVITADGQEATIEQGRQIPYQEGTAGTRNGPTIAFKKAVLSLDVTPKITPDDKVKMNLEVTQNSVGENVPTLGGGFVPSIDTRSLTTQVLVDDGDTVVLGGVYEQSNQNQTSGVPFLKDIPLIGRLFRSTQRQRIKQELLVFLTPSIVRPELATQ